MHRPPAQSDFCANLRAVRCLSAKRVSAISRQIRDGDW